MRLGKKKYQLQNKNHFWQCIYYCHMPSNWMANVVLIGKPILAKNILATMLVKCLAEIQIGHFIFNRL